MKTFKQILKARIPYWGVMLTFLTIIGLLFGTMFLPHNHRGSDKAACIINQRNIQQAVRAYAGTHFLKTGDPIDWSKIIGIGQYIERIAACPIHGTGAYEYSRTITPLGILAAPCKDLAHKPSIIDDW